MNAVVRKRQYYVLSFLGLEARNSAELQYRMIHIELSLSITSCSKFLKYIKFSRWFRRVLLTAVTDNDRNLSKAALYSIKSSRQDTTVFFCIG